VKLVRLVILAALVLSPWFFGGIEARSQAALMLCGGLALAAWLFLAPRQEDHPLPLAVLPLLAAVCLAAIQLAPLPASLVEFVSPGTAELRSELLDGRSSTETLSLYPASTRLDLYRLALALSMFALGACLFASGRTLAVACALISVNGAAIAVFGIVQRLTWNGRMFWSVPLTRGVPFGPFINKNNACGYLLLCLAAALGLLVWTFSQEERRSRALRLAALALTGCIVAGILATLSRGGFLALAAVALVTVGILMQARGRGHLAALLGAVIVIACALVFWSGMSGDVQARVRTLFEPGSSDIRFAHWRDALRAVPDFWPAGSGLGTYRYVYPAYEQSPHRVLFYHAENQYVEALLEGGVLGLGLLLAAMGLVVVAVRALWRVPCLFPAIVGAAALAGQAVAGCFDFGLYLPANMLLMALLSGAVSGWAARDVPGRFLKLPSSQRLMPSLAALVAVLTLFGASELWRVHRLKQAMANADRQTLAAILAQRDDDAEGHRELAALWMNSSGADVRKHLLLSRQACPLLSDVHLRLADGMPADAAHVQRAARVLPTGATCRFRCGQLSLSAGRVQDACRHWRRSLELSDRHEAEILDAASTLLTAKELAEEVLPASPQVLVRIARRRFAGEDQAYRREALVGRAAELLDQQTLPEPERCYVRASIRVLRGDVAGALADYARAIELNPNEIVWRYEYAQALFEQRQLEEALVHARWCARRDPERAEYRRLLEQIHQKRLRQR
jgi:O-antigen ligase